MSTKLFDPHPWNLETLFKTNVFDIPVYQRPYSWDIEQVDTLLCDVYNSFQENKEVSYYVGNIILHDKNEKINGNILKFEIIDGQQRITTFCLILLASFCLMNEFDISPSDNTYVAVKSCLWKYISRNYVPEYQAVSLNSIEKECFKNLYNYCYDCSNREFNVKNYCSNYSSKNKFEERILKNFIYIYDYIKNKFSDKNDEFLDFVDYIIQNTDFIVIETASPENKVFSMFESINSKGKKLDEIDLFKTFIFSNLDVSDFQNYLNIWGRLIIETEDDLYDYIYTFIKAYITFYRQYIYIHNFKSICKSELLEYYHASSVKDALKSFLQDLLAKVKYYKMLKHPESANDLIKNTKFKFYYYMFTELKYKHPKPLFMRALEEYDHEKFSSKEELVDVFSETIKFMVEFLTLGKRDSKDVITFFSGVMNEIYKSGKINLENLKLSIVGELIKQGITIDKLKSDLKSIDAFSQKSISKFLLALYESSREDENGKFKVSYDQAYFLMKNYDESFSLDHLLVQTPDADSPNFKYYKDEANNTLVLKNGHDFPEEIATTGLGYDVFTTMVLNKIGNLRIYYKDKNSGRGNSPIDLPEYPDFYTYAKVVERNDKIANVLFDQILVFPNVDKTKVTINNPEKEDDSLPKMDELISKGVVNIGDELYIKGYPETSKATLIDSKFVDFNGEQMTLNEWGCSITGWKSIRIYAHAIIVGEKETLHEKRLKMIEEENEN